MRTSSRLLTAAAALAAAVTLSGCSVLNSFLPATGPERDDDGAITQADDNADVFELRQGDCLNSSDLTGAVSSVPVVPCGEAHEDEIYLSYKMTDAVFPGKDATTAQADQVCLDAFEGFVGKAYADSTLDFWYFYPSAETWKSGDREILCAVYSTEETMVTGSLASSGR